MRGAGADNFSISARSIFSFVEGRELCWVRFILGPFATVLAICVYMCLCVCVCVCVSVCVCSNRCMVFFGFFLCLLLFFFFCIIFQCVRIFFSCCIFVCVPLVFQRVCCAWLWFVLWSDRERRSDSVRRLRRGRAVCSTNAPWLASPRRSEGRGGTARRRWRREKRPCRTGPGSWNTSSNNTFRYARMQLKQNAQVCSYTAQTKRSDALVLLYSQIGLKWSPRGPEAFTKCNV
jgi:hypothetical protein